MTNPDEIFPKSDRDFTNMSDLKFNCIVQSMDDVQPITSQNPSVDYEDSQ